MEWLTALFLARIKFAFLIGFHIIFPTLTVGLAVYLFVLEIKWLRTRDPAYLKLYKLWAKIFAVSFGMGVVSGIPMSFQFGTNWGPFAESTTNIVGVLLGFEVLSAFFLEATFLGIMLFGWNRVRPGIHLLATGMVMLGTTLSVYWIMAVNSWMQFPQGTVLKEGIFYVVDWGKILWNTNLFYHMLHVLLSSYITMSFVVMGIMALYIWRKKDIRTSVIGFKVALIMASICVPTQVIMGDFHGRAACENNPTKVAAMEGHWETQKGAPAILFGWPDMENEKNHFEIKIPKLASLYLKGSFDAEVQGLKSVAPEDRPFVPLVFFSFRIMVGIGVLFLLMAMMGWFVIWRRQLETARWYLGLSFLVSPLGFVATFAGWIVTEVGRQPWLIYKLLRTSKAASPNVPAAAIQSSLVVFGIVYLILFVAYMYYTIKIIRKGMEEEVNL